MILSQRSVELITVDFCHSQNLDMDYPDEVIIEKWLQKKEKEQALQLVLVLFTYFC